MSSYGPPGFEAPVFRSLYEPILLGGAPRDFVIMHSMTALVLSVRVGLRGAWLVLMAAAVVHTAVAIGTHLDPQFLDVLSKAFRSPPRLDP
jgi:type IV secretory pathway TrbD component